jgi:membrane-bound lytic murein transglycosylase B
VLKYILLSLLISSPLYAKQTFEQWKKSYAKKAAKHGLPQKFVLSMLEDVTVDETVIEKDRNQVILDKKRDYNDFIKRWMRTEPSRIEQGRIALQENLELLQRVEKKYGVEKEVIVSLWGVETFYGQITGDYDLVRSLATLAYDGRRRKFFEIQLNASLRLIKQGHVKREDLKGSWAGATGQCQFMPSNIPAYARDFDGDGKKDIWNNKADLFASIAYFLKKVGWQKGKSIGSLALNNKGKELNKTKYRTKNTYSKLGFTELDGSKISGNWRARRIATIPMKNSPVVLRGSNYKPLTTWNNSSLFAAFNILLVEGLMQK